jgi:peptidoglycan/xylan/chitin deacetylase (PgdA/CDA1 family)
MIGGVGLTQTIRHRVAITVDVETDWGGRLRPSRGSLWGIHKGLPRMLNVLNAAGVKVTFFISAEVIPYVRAVFSELVAAGHEIASHGLQHRNLVSLSTEELRHDVVRSKVVLEEVLNVQVRGFRAPQGRVHNDLFSVLAQSGYVYDSSMMGTFFPGRYRNQNLPAHPFWQEGVIEIPGTVLPGLPVPMGLLWLNLLGPRVWQWLLRQPQLPELVSFYSHPFDVLTQKPRSAVNLPLRVWYSTRAGRALETFSMFVNYWKARGARFITLSEACAEFTR